MSWVCEGVRDAFRVVGSKRVDYTDRTAAWVPDEQDVTDTTQTPIRKKRRLNYTWGLN